MSEEQNECDGGITKDISIVPFEDVEFRYCQGWSWMPGEEFTATMIVPGPVDATVNDIPVKAVADERGGITITITQADQAAMRGLQDLRDALSEFPPTDQPGEAGE